ncbi:FAD binding domain-containing protein [Paraliomyxa miuraensis]|uniref:FAD binding domain-containing protein n=1 Tax=Paraliomyxa miuraensis TaxID=376150 RepID=UPI0022564A5B|nr:FAD binding domain-containing protein [Paraliomyxa miuraensis]MCX4239910.1 FAD binding domain-containing protein [Paraliomyxa miuraensis]
MIRFPTSLTELEPAAGGSAPVVRAGATDLTERRRLRMAAGPLLDLRDLPGLDTVEPDGTGGMLVGAKLRIAELAVHPGLAAAYPGLCAAAGALATPQIRAVATLGGNLLQANRCWYYRNPDERCLKKGGAACLARQGDHIHHACFDLGPCACVHPSTLGMALMAYEASVMVHGAADRTVAELYGDGSDPSRDHRLEPGAVLTHVVLPPPRPREQAAYFRTITRARSEWPLVEVLVRLVMDGDTVSLARVAMGGVAPVPLRLPEVEAALVGGPASAEALAKAAAIATKGATPLPMTGYKVDLVEGTVLETLERACHSTPSLATPSSGSLPEADEPPTPNPQGGA